MRWLVDHFPKLDPAVIAGHDVVNPRLLDLRRWLAVGPGRDSVLVTPEQRMTLEANTLLSAPVHNSIGISIVRLATFGFVPPPVETHGGIVEQFGKPLFVGGILGFQLAAIEAVDVAAKEKLVAGLDDRDLGIDDRLASGIHDAECDVRLAILLDGRGGSSDNCPFSLLGRLGR